MTQKPEHHQPYERDEAEIVSWFQTLEPRQPFSPSPYLRAKVLAEVEQRQFQQGWWARLSAWCSPVEFRVGKHTVFAMGLIVALSGVVWWGIREFGHHQPDARRIALHRQSDPAGLWPTYQFQQHLPRAAGPGSLVLPDTVLKESPREYGFAPLPAATWHFRLGMGYVEALALLQSDHRARAAQRVDGMVETLLQIQAPVELITYLRAMQTTLQGPQTTGGVLVPFLAAFEPLYAAVYTTANATEVLTYFRLGTWLANLSLAVTVGDQMALRQGPVIQALRHTLTQYGAAPVVLDTLARLQDLMTQPILTDQEIPQLHALVQELQRLLRD